MNEDQIKHMVDRFLMWRLPETFSPDGGVHFEGIAGAGPMPVGTNLFDATQALAMVRHMIEGMPELARPVDPHQTERLPTSHGHKLRVGRGYTARNGKIVNVEADLGGGIFRGECETAVIIYREDGTTLADGWQDYNIHWPPTWEPEVTTRECLELHSGQIAALADRVDNLSGILHNHNKRVVAIEATLARIEDMLTSEKCDGSHSMRFSTPPAGFSDYSQGLKIGPTRYGNIKVRNCTAGPTPPVPRKSLGWVNVMPDSGGSILVDDRLSPTREHADLCARMNRGATRIACIEIFEGEGL